ncbi:hypothetical protein [Mucilaginibacter sp. PAMB04168]|uniref:hypothetical protein n=1 Tax=Mucilaginibacter sp. PAMB04168 TaxID=3138567 RepID=UPI0031F617AA
MSLNNTYNKSWKIIGLCLLLGGSVSAQKKPDMAEGVKAPAAVKIDGKHNEWGTLPEYNKSTSLRYTLANDANNLYLAITSTDQLNINKLLGGGLTFTINKDGKKKEKDAATFVYPFVTRGRGFRMGGGGRGRQGGGDVDTVALVASRKQAVAGMKELSVTGVKEITDTLVSIYNTYGFKTAINFDTKGNLFYELAIPLKLLELDASKQTELAYNVKLNGIQMGNGGGMRIANRQGGGDGGGGNGGGNGGGFGGGGFGGQMMDMMTATDFWGKYKLAKP